MDLIERVLASTAVVALGAFSWVTQKGKADKALMDERHDVRVLLDGTGFT